MTYRLVKLRLIHRMVEKSQFILLTSPFTEVNLIQKEAMNQKKAKHLVNLSKI